MGLDPEALFILRTEDRCTGVVCLVRLVVQVVSRLVDRQATPEHLVVRQFTPEHLALVLVTIT